MPLKALSLTYVRARFSVVNLCLCGYAFTIDGIVAGIILRCLTFLSLRFREPAIERPFMFFKSGGNAGSVVFPILFSALSGACVLERASAGPICDLF